MPQAPIPPYIVLISCANLQHPMLNMREVVRHYSENAWRYEIDESINRSDTSPCQVIYPACLCVPHQFWEITRAYGIFYVYPDAPGCKLPVGQDQNLCINIHTLVIQRRLFNLASSKTFWQLWNRNQSQNTRWRVGQANVFFFFSLLSIKMFNLSPFSESDKTYCMFGNFRSALKQKTFSLLLSVSLRHSSFCNLCFEVWTRFRIAALISSRDSVLKAGTAN